MALLNKNNQESLATFFDDSLVGEEEDGDLDKIKWVTAFNKLGINMTKKEIIKIFDYIDDDECGYVDRFDFMQFCNSQSFKDKKMRQLKEKLIARIDAFLRFSQIGMDESIQIIYSKHTVNPRNFTTASSNDQCCEYFDEDDAEQWEENIKRHKLCCSHCSKPFFSFISWKKHESKCKYDAEKYIAHLILSMEQDFDISFLNESQSPNELSYSCMDHQIPPPPPLNEYALRYNGNEMADILSTIPDKIAIWSRLFVSTQSENICKRIKSLKNGNSKSYIKCTQQSAEKDYFDVLQQKMFDLLLSSDKTEKSTSQRRKSHQALSPNINSIKTRQNKAHSIHSPSQIAQNIIKFKPKMNENGHSRPIQVGAGEESDIDDYDFEETDFDQTKFRLSMSINLHPNSDNETNNQNNQYALAANIGAPRSKSSFNLKIQKVQQTKTTILPIMNQLTTGQQTLGSVELSDDFSSRSMTAMSTVMNKKTENESKELTENSDVSSLPSISDKEENNEDYDGILTDVMLSNPLANTSTHSSIKQEKEQMNVYENLIEIILEFAALKGCVYMNGYLMLHQMVFDIFSNEYNTIWHKYRLPIWLKLLFDGQRLNELQKYYKEHNICNNCEHGQEMFIWNLFDMIFYDQSLFTHLIHCYGIPPSLRPLLWYHLSHNHHNCTDLDIFCDEYEWNQSDAPMIDWIFDSMLKDKYCDDFVQFNLMKSFLFQPMLHHKSHSMNVQNTLICKNKKKMHLNLYSNHERNVFYFDILHVLLKDLWSELPIACQSKIYEFWSKIEQETNGNYEWLFGDGKIIQNILKNGDCEFMLSLYLWDGMFGICLLVTSIILAAIHSKKSLPELYKEPLMNSKIEMNKIQKTYRFLYEYIVNKHECNDNSISLIVLRKLCHLSTD